MRIITWNVHGANKDSAVWEFLLKSQPDIVLLQEVGGIPEKIEREFDILSKVAIYKTGKPQRFSTAILAKGKIIEEIKLRSEHDWVNRELDFFKGNLVGCIVQLPNQTAINAVSVYSPAWPVDKKRLSNADVSSVKLKDNPDVWVTEIIWSALKSMVLDGQRWVVGGDYNSCETFDREWQEKNGTRFGICSSGNKEVRERMYGIGFTECLREYNGKITPTFQHSSKQVAHQMDHLFVTNNLYPQLKQCVTGDSSIVFGKSLSDHLPIVADFG